MTGLFAFFYGTLHFLIYVIADRFAGLDFPDGIVSLHDRARPGGLGRRGHLQAAVHHDRLHGVDDDGAARADVDAGMIRRLGGKRWQALHRLVYVTAIAGVIHYWWLVKSDIRPPLRYAIIVGILLGARMIRASLRARNATGPRMPAAAPAQKAR